MLKIALPKLLEKPQVIQKNPQPNPQIKLEEIRLRPVEIKKPANEGVQRTAQFIPEQETIRQSLQAAGISMEKSLEKKSQLSLPPKTPVEIIEPTPDKQDLSQRLEQLEKVYSQHLRNNSERNFQVSLMQEKAKELKNKIQVISYIKESIEY